MANSLGRNIPGLFVKALASPKFLHSLLRQDIAVHAAQAVRQPVGMKGTADTMCADIENLALEATKEQGRSSSLKAFSRGESTEVLPWRHRLLRRCRAVRESRALRTKQS